MRIGFFTDGFLPQPNGVATSVFESARELERRGHEVYIVAPKYPGYVDKNDHVIRVSSLKVVSKPEIRMALNLPDRGLRKILSMDFDIIHAHGGGPVTLMGWEVARSKKIPYVITYHTLWNRYTHYFLKGKIVTPKMMNQATKIFGNSVDYIIAPTKRVDQELRQYGVKKPIKIVPSGIDVDKFVNSEKGFLRSKTHSSLPIVLFVGRLGREKEVDFLIKSFREVLKQTQAEFIIVGDGAERKKLEALVKRLAIEKYVKFLGDVDSRQMHKVYKDASVFVFSSTTETQGLVVPEALSSGVPVVAVDDPAYECIENGVNGYLAEHDVNKFADKVITMLTDSALRARLSEGATASAQKFSVTSTVDSLEKVYGELLEKHNNNSIVRIMETNKRQEIAYSVGFIFWITVILLRLTVFFSDTLSYPVFSILGQSFYHAAVGIIFLLLAVVTVFKKKGAGFLTVLFLGIGMGFVADEAWSVITAHQAAASYWNPLNFLSIMIVGVIPFILSRGKIKDRPEFYINTSEQAHVNPENPKISVVMPAYNEGEFIGETLKSLLAQTYKEFELIVVDNNSTDNTSDVAKRYGAKVVYEKNKGVAHARQAGFMAARGQIIICTDSDSILPQDWVQNMLTEFEIDKTVVAYGGLGFLYSGPVAARAACRYLFSAFWIIDKFVSGGWNLAGFNMGVRSEAFHKIGGFNTTLTLGEDIDLAKRLREVGKIKIKPDFSVFVSGRRYRHGLIAGVMTYAPSYVMRVIFKTDKFLYFPAIRSEKHESSGLFFVPGTLIVIFLGTLFWIKNAQLVDKLKLF